MNTRKQQSGFTLVEIAIVLVIIGLLLGGILKGQELITSARVRNVADQSSAVQAAYYGFIDRYRLIPGDMLPGSANPNSACNALGTANFTSCGTMGGNANGRIDDTGGLIWQEAMSVWAQLAAAGFLQGPYATQAAPGSFTVAEYTSNATPRAPTNPWGGFLLLGRSADYQPGGGQPVRLHLVLGRNIPVAVARELDVKIDDGLPQSGVLRGAPTAATVYSTVGDQAAACTTAAAPFVWDINQNAADCNAYYLY